MREMKDSGIEWVGNIPNDWSVLRNKYNFTLGKALVGQKWNETQLLSLTKNGVKKIEDGEQTGKVPASLATYQKVKIDDLVMCLFDLDCSAVFSGVSNYDGMISPAYKCFKCKYHIYHKYADYYFRTVFIDRKYKRYSKNVRFSITAEEFLNLPIVVPPIYEQKKISLFLDSKCADIDSLISDIQSEIKTLEEYKKSVITEAVTKGLNPDVEMKGSGIEWIGKIPIDWECIRGKDIFAQKSDKGNSKSLTLLSPTQNYGVIPQELYEVLTGFSAVKLNEKTDLNSLKTVHKGAFVISLRSFQGGFEYSDYEGVVSPAYQVFYPSKSIYDGYYKHLFKTQIFIDKMNCYTMSLRDGKNIAFSDFGRTYIPVPSVGEQKVIADYLDEICSEINRVIKEKNKQLETLEEYEKSIIYEYVTGKKEVPEG
ncbi:MAG: restriction endonuclease subunit S [Clostridiales bacterium]|nr:restriction endonuclease subunit S [Candidatus Crickella equi]